MNLTGPVSILPLAANHLEQQGAGFIVAISSVAETGGGRATTFTARLREAFQYFMQGLRNRLFRSGVRLITVKPGFADTRMTFGMKGLLFLAPPEKVADGIYRAIRKGRDEVYIPAVWRFVMLLIKAVPESLFKRLNL